MKTVPSPNYTQVPNCILDNLGKFSGTELAIMAFICRMTFGWHRKRARLTLNDLCAGTGRAKDSVCSALNRLCDEVCVRKFSSPNGNEYELIIGGENSEEPEGEVGRKTGQPLVGKPDNRLVGKPDNRLVGKPDNPIRVKKVLKEKDTSAGAEATIPGKLDGAKVAEFKAFIDWWTHEFPKAHHGEPYVFGGAKDGSALKRLLGAGLNLEKLQRIAAAAWKHSTLFNCKQAVTISGMASRINEIRDELNAQRATKGATISPAQEIRSLETERRDKAQVLEEYNQLLQHDCNRTPENIGIRKAARERVAAIDARLKELRP